MKKKGREARKTHARDGRGIPPFSQSARKGWGGQLRVGCDVCDGGHRLDVIKRQLPIIAYPVASSQYFAKLHYGGGIPGLENRETWGTPGFPLSTFKDNSRYTRAGDVGHPPVPRITRNAVVRNISIGVVADRGAIPTGHLVGNIISRSPMRWEASWL